MVQLFTTRGPKSAGELGMILPHEHIFVDLRTPDQPGYAQAEASDVISLMKPEVEKARAVGVAALCECSAVGVGRRIDILKAFSDATGFPLVVPTGVYREPWVPVWVQEASEDELREWMTQELQNQIGETGVKAGWVKLSAGDDGITETETKVLRAAAKAAATVNAVIGSHTIKGRVVNDQLDILEDAGYTPERFIWIHTQNESDLDLILEIAARGVWVEYDAIGSESRDDAFFIERIKHILDAGFGEKLLLSHDRGWYDPAKPGGGEPRPFTYISEIFLPKLKGAGVDDDTIKQLTHTNPFNAFARE